MTFRPNLGHFQVISKYISMNIYIYMRERIVKCFLKCKQAIRTYKEENN